MKITAKKNKFPNTEPWDDFLDFSRWRTPHESVVLKRLVDNALLFSGNWLWVWATLTLSYGLFVNWRILASFIIIAIGWWAADSMYRTALNQTVPSLMEANDGRLVNSKRLEKDVSLPPSAKGWLALFSVFILYEFAVILPLLLSAGGTLLLASLHSMARPIVNEVYFVHAHQKAVAQHAQEEKQSNDFHGQRGEEHELTFSPEVGTVSDSSNH